MAAGHGSFESVFVAFVIWFSIFNAWYVPYSYAPKPSICVARHNEQTNTSSAIRLGEALPGPVTSCT